MASGQTQYYGLSQWEAVDKVERVDFNSDNAKIDGALHALAEQVQPLVRAVPQLAYYIGQLAILDLLDRGQYLGQRAMLYEAFLHPEDLPLSGGGAHLRPGEWKGRQDGAGRLGSRSPSSVRKPLLGKAGELDTGRFCILIGSGSVQDTGRTICTPAAGLYHQCAIRHLTSGPAQQGDGAVYHCQSSPGRGDIRLGDSLEGSSSFRETAAGEVEFFSLGSVGTGVLGQGCSRDRNSFWGFGSVGLASGVEFEDLSAIRLFCSEPMNKGGSFILYGLQR